MQRALGWNPSKCLLNFLLTGLNFFLSACYPDELSSSGSMEGDGPKPEPEPEPAADEGTVAIAQYEYVITPHTIVGRR